MKMEWKTINNKMMITPGKWDEKGTPVRKYQKLMMLNFMGLKKPLRKSVYTQGR